MPTLFNRAVSVIVDTLQVNDLRVTFKVSKTLKKEPNTAEIAITNLAEKSRAQMQQKGAKVILMAGYAPDRTQRPRLIQLFSGDARFITHEHKRPDWVTKIDCGDGERQYQWARVSDSFAPGVKVSTVIERVIDALGVDPGTSKTTVRQITDQFVNGCTLHGRASSELDRLLAGRGYEWSIQAGRLQILKAGQAVSLVPVTVLRADTGLLGSPAFANSEAKQVGGVDLAPGVGTRRSTVLKVRALLQPQIKPGDAVDIASKHVNGRFRVQSVDHEGDTAGEQWYTSLECIPLS